MLYDLVIKRSPRRKTVALRVLNARTVELRAPQWVSDEYLKALLSKREQWLQKVLSSCPEPMSFHDGAHFMIDGESYLLRWYQPLGRGRVYLSEKVLFLPVNNVEAAAKSLRQYLRQRAAEVLLARCQELALQMGRKPSNVLVRSFTARWGSCDSQGVIKLNWRLIMAPTDVRDYVIIHELAHMVEMNHSVHFWREVESWMPNYKQHYQWLKQHGPILLAV